VPGRSGSPLAAGPHALIRGGATLIRGADDLLDLLHVASLAGRAEPPSTSLPEHLQAVLCAVGSGRDTHGRLLAGAHGEAIDLLGALGELELLGLLARGEGGRYLVRHSIIR
jgi:DNA processing protein